MPFAIDEITINLLVDIPENKSIIDTLFIEDSKVEHIHIKYKETVETEKEGSGKKEEKAESKSGEKHFVCVWFGTKTHRAENTSLSPTIGLSAMKKWL
jgi:hypothetical protein